MIRATSSGEATWKRSVLSSTNRRTAGVIHPVSGGNGLDGGDGRRRNTTAPSSRRTVAWVGPHRTVLAHNTCVTTQKHAKVDERTPVTAETAAQGPDQRFFFALTRRQSMDCIPHVSATRPLVECLT